MQPGAARIRVLSVSMCTLERTWHASCSAHACRYGPCEQQSLKERMKRAVALLGEQEVHSIMRQEGKIEVRRGCYITSEHRL